MGEALRQAAAALAAGEFPVGCVLVRGEGIVAAGARRGSRAPGGGELGHAEMVALQALSGKEEASAPLRAFVTLEPCLMCFAALLLHGVGEIVFAFEDVMGGATTLDRSRLAPLYRNRPLRVQGGVRRAESLRLLQAFYRDPGNAYWQGSLLAAHILAQPE
ncbi:MAG: deaminase [Desulfobacterales bacterium]